MQVLWGPRASRLGPCGWAESSALRAIAGILGGLWALGAMFCVFAVANAMS